MKLLRTLQRGSNFRHSHLRSRCLLASDLSNSFRAFSDKRRIGLSSNLVDSLIMRLYRPELVHACLIHVVSWTLIGRAVSENLHARKLIELGKIWRTNSLWDSPTLIKRWSYSPHPVPLPPPPITSNPTPRRPLISREIPEHSQTNRSSAQVEMWWYHTLNYPPYHSPAIYMTR